MTVAAFVGVPGSGKTKKAVELALDESTRSKRPILAVDPGRVWNFEGWNRAGTLEAAVTMLWEDRVSCAWSPDRGGGLEEFDRLMEAARAGGEVIVLADEVRWFASAQYLSRPLSLLARTWRHARVSLYLTTQRFGDLHGDLVACLSELYVFRCTAPRDLDRLSREFGIEREVVGVLAKEECRHQRVGFER